VEGAIARHLADAHDVEDFELLRDVAFGEHVPEDPAVAYRAPTNGARAGFQCARCPHREFFGEPDYGDPHRQALLEVASPELSLLLRGVPAADRSRVIADWDSGRMGQDLARDARRRRQMATRPAARPMVAARRERCQRFLLERYVERGRLEDAIAALIDLHQSDPQRHLEIVGRRHPLAESTYKKYWGDIPHATRERARQEARRREDARRTRKKSDR
jgi:hypothetical protein